MSQLDLLPAAPLPAEAIAEKTIPLDLLPGDDELLGPPPSPRLVNSITLFGVIEPVVVIEGAGAYRLVDGRRRVRGARKAGLKKIPARVFPEGTCVGEVLTLLLNEERSANPVAEVQAIEALLDRGASEEDIVLATGLTKPKLRRRMALLGLAKPLRQAFFEGRLAPGAADAAAKLGVTYQNVLVAALAEKGKVTVEDVVEVKAARAKEAVNGLPNELFERPEKAFIPPPAALDPKAPPARIISLLEEVEAWAEENTAEAIRDGVLRHLNCAVALLYEWEFDCCDGKKADDVE